MGAGVDTETPTEPSRPQDLSVLPRAGRDGVGEPVRAYADMVHEVGHLIGIPEPYPKFESSVMNYNQGVLGSEDDAKPEPDCSPYPIDVMAAYALYQTGS